MNYTLHQLRIFLKIYQTKSITKAAEELHLTQPAVSIQLKNLQQQFEIPLIEVIHKKIYITDFGKEIARSAEKILEEIYGINYRMHTQLGKLTGQLKFSIVSTGIYAAPYFISDFLAKHPDIQLIMDVTNKSKVIESLEKNEVDFSLVSVLPEKMLIEKVELMQNKLFVVGNKEIKSKKKAYNKDIFERIPLIYREEGSGTRQAMEKFIMKNNLPVIKKMELTSNEAVKQAVIAGLGYSIMPLIGIKNELQSGQLHIIPVYGFPIKSKWYLIWLKGKKFSPSAEAFIKYLKIEKENIVLDKFAWYEDY